MQAPAPEEAAAAMSRVAVCLKEFRECPWASAPSFFGLHYRKPAEALPPQLSQQLSHQPARQLSLLECATAKPCAWALAARPGALEARLACRVRHSFETHTARLYYTAADGTAQGQQQAVAQRNDSIAETIGLKHGA